MKHDRVCKNGFTVHENMRSIWQLYRQGLSNNEIAHEVGVSYSTIYKLVKNIKEIDEQQRELYASWIKPLKTIKQVAIEVNMSTSSIRDRLIRLSEQLSPYVCTVKRKTYIAGQGVEIIKNDIIRCAEKRINKHTLVEVNQ